MALDRMADSRLAAAVEAADQLMKAGRLDEAAKAWEQVLARAPEHPRALLHLGQHLLYRGQVPQARAMLQRAAEADPKNPIVPLNLSFVSRTVGDAVGEMSALTQALVLDPYLVPALLAQAALYERIGKPRLAAKVYHDVLTIVPDVPAEPWLAKPLAHARAAVAANRESIAAHLAAPLADVAARHPGADTARFAESRDIMIGARKAYLSSPTLLHYPRLPAVPFYDRADFAWLADVEAQTPVIQAELSRLLAGGGAGFAPYVHHPDGAPLNQWAGLNHSPDWSAYFLLKDGKRVEQHCTQCPKTASLLASLPLAQIPGIAPSAFFSALKPRTQIPPHTGVTNTRLIVHLPLVVPEGCWYRVGNERRQWVPGEALIFDDSIEHEAWNGSDQMRFLLIFDIWHPGLSTAEQDLVAELLVNYEAYYRAES